MSDIGIEVLQALKNTSISEDEIDVFVQEVLNISLAKEVLQITDQLSGDRYSMLTLLNIAYPEKLTPLLTEFVREMDALYKMELPYNSFRTNLSLIRTKYYRNANPWEREVLSSACSIGVGSMEYWKDNIRFWKPEANGWGWDILKTVLKNMARTDFCVAVGIMLKSKGLAAIVWKEVAVISGAASAIEGVATLIFDSWIFNLNSSGEVVCVLPGEKELSIKELEKSIFEEYLQKKNMMDE